ncbi:MAG: T9SS type A sorting domain-containing protein [Bacteroidetes bacterium]|nr:MAG: T9SS type A sorting domain-containing protein [Bacteroidota bacterium]
MKASLALLMTLCSFWGLAQFPLRDTLEFNPRDGLPNFFNKIHQGDTVRVAYFGGSITHADFWRPPIIEWMRSHYGNNVIDTNVSIGGSNSKHGVFRIDEDILSGNQYDLIFVEFAVNDQSFAKSEDVERSFEGLVRKIWQHNSGTDICFVYTVRELHLYDIRFGKMNLTASKQDSIASHYGIPSIFLGTRVEHLLRQDSIVFYDPEVDLETSKAPDGSWVLTRDNLHPTKFGTAHYVEVIQNALMKMESNGFYYEHPLPMPAIHNHYTSASMLAVQDSLNHGFDVIDSLGQKSAIDEFMVRDRRYMISEDASDTYRFHFEGSEFGINLLVGPGVGYFKVKIDGAEREYKIFDGYCMYYRPQYRFFKLAHGPHEVEIRTSERKLSLEEKEELLLGFRKKDIQNFPHKYDRNEFLFSEIFLYDDPPVPTIDFADSLIFCEGDSVQLSSNYVLGNTWSNGDTSNVVWIREPGTVSFSVRDQSGELQGIDSVFLEMIPGPGLEATILSEPDDCESLEGSIRIEGEIGSLLLRNQKDSIILEETPFILDSLKGGIIELSLENKQCRELKRLELINSEALAAWEVNPSGTNQLVCTGDSVWFSKRGEYAIEWKGHFEQDSVLVWQSDTLVFRINDSGCLSVWDTIYVQERERPEVRIDMDSLWCIQEGEIVLNFASPAGGSWRVDGETTEVLNPSKMDTGMVMVNYSLNWSGCEGEDSLRITIADCPESALKEVISEKRVSIFPNPVADVLYIDGVTEGDQLALYDAQGRQVFRLVGVETKLDLRSFSPGIYLLQVTGERQHPQSFRLVISP